MRMKGERGREVARGLLVSCLPTEIRINAQNMLEACTVLYSKFSYSLSSNNLHSTDCIHYPRTLIPHILCIFAFLWYVLYCPSIFKQNMDF